MRNQLFHLPSGPDEPFGTCDIKKICAADDHGPDCQAKCHEEHQQMAVKGHGGSRYVLVDDHGAHLVIEHDLTPNDFDGVSHVREVATDGECKDCEFEIWTEAEWGKEVRRLARENVKRAEKNEPLLTQADRKKPPAPVQA